MTRSKTSIKTYIARKKQKKWKEVIRNKKLTKAEDINMLKEPIREGELKNILFKKMKEGKAPGNDGLIVSVYKKLWKALKRPLTESIMEGIRKGELSTSQRQSIIRLIKKKDKNLSELKNWRPQQVL